MSVLLCVGRPVTSAQNSSIAEHNGITKSDSAVVNVVPDISIVYYQIEHSDKYMNVEINMDLSELKVRSNRAILLVPRLVNGSDSLELPSIGIYGRDRHYIYTRNGISTLSDEDELSFTAKDKPASVSYNNLVSYADWMNGSTLKLYRSDWGCCKTKVAEYEGVLGQHCEESTVEEASIAEFFPELVYVSPKPETMKNRSLSGSAFIDFPVDRTVIYPDYRRNTVELAKIHASIDSVRNDADVNITSVWLKGFASPESPYKHNTELAIGRTASLKEHIRQLYNFQDNIIQTDYEPEDWDGLRRFVANSNIDHREEIIAMIDSDMDPDAKELKIKRMYPEQYRFLLQFCYPALRHTDYRIEYTVRTYSSIEEIERIYEEQPSKLSLNEFYLLAAGHKPGSDKFTEIFETAVRIYPNDPVANLNAANAAMRHGNHDHASLYLKKAGESAEAVYARGAYAIRTEDYDAARNYLVEAREMGLEKAATTLDELEIRLK